MLAAFKLNPAALAISTPASKHEDSSSGGFGGSDGNGVVLEGPALMGEGDGSPATGS